MPPGNAEAASVINPALEAIWVGDMTAEEAMKAAVPEANKILEAAK
jgi:ABC-type glycerol-3-phosphate transport system substrate-binding protein